MQGKTRSREGFAGRWGEGEKGGVLYSNQTEGEELPKEKHWVPCQPCKEVDGGKKNTEGRATHQRGAERKESFKTVGIGKKRKQQGEKSKETPKGGKRNDAKKKPQTVGSRGRRNRVSIKRRTTKKLEGSRKVRKMRRVHGLQLSSRVRVWKGACWGKTETVGQRPSNAHIFLSLEGGKTAHQEGKNVLWGKDEGGGQEQQAQKGVGGGFDSAKLKKNGRAKESGASRRKEKIYREGLVEECGKKMLQQRKKNLETKSQIWGDRASGMGGGNSAGEKK